VLEDLLRYGSRYDMVPAMPDRLQELLYRCFEEQPSDRPEDMWTVAEVVKQVYREETGGDYPRRVAHHVDDSLEVLNNRAVSYLDLNRSADAEAIWNEIVERDPDHIEAIYNKHLHYWKHGRITDAQMVERMYRLVEEHPGAWQPAYLLARVLIERGDAELALKVLEGLERTPENKREISFGMAMAQNHVGRDRKLAWEFDPGTMKVTAVALSFDGWRLITGGLNGQIRVWETPTKQCTAVLNGHTERIHSLRLSEDEQLALSGSADKTLRVWDPMTGKCIQTLKGHIGCVRSAVLNSTGKQALSGSDDGTLMLWDTGSGRRLRIYQGHRAGVNSVAMTRSGEFAYSGSSDGTVRQWEIASGACVGDLTDFEGRVTSIALSYGDDRLLCASGLYLYLYDLMSGDLVQKIRGHTKEIFSIGLNESGRLAVSATGMGTIKVWDIERGQCLRSFQGHAPIALSRDGRYCGSGGKQGEFKLWSVSLDDAGFPAQYVLSKGAAG